MKVLLFQLDGKIPNIALMRIAAHHREHGNEVELRRAGNFPAVEPNLGDEFDAVYASAIFERTRNLVLRMRAAWGGLKVTYGGTGTGDNITLEELGIGLRQDYSVYPEFRQSIGFTQRGCRLKCSFCVVPKKEGAVRPEQGIYDIWRGDPWPRELLLLDNDFFGQPDWRKHIADIRDGGFKVSFNQGINARCLTEEAAEAIGSVDYRDDSMKVKRIYTAWDNLDDEERLLAGLERLVKYGVKPDQIMVYMLIGYWRGETSEARDRRRRRRRRRRRLRLRLREFGCRPYPMPYVRTKELVGFQRFVVGAYDKRFTWEQWERAGYRPENL